MLGFLIICKCTQNQLFCNVHSHLWYMASLIEPMVDGFLVAALGLNVTVSVCARFILQHFRVQRTSKSTVILPLLFS